MEPVTNTNFTGLSKNILWPLIFKIAYFLTNYPSFLVMGSLPTFFTPGHVWIIFLFLPFCDFFLNAFWVYFDSRNFHCIRRRKTGADFRVKIERDFSAIAFSRKPEILNNLKLENVIFIYINSKMFDNLYFSFNKHRFSSCYFTINNRELGQDLCSKF